jgi:hypothetical protein
VAGTHDEQNANIVQDVAVKHEFLKWNNTARFYLPI